MWQSVIQSFMSIRRPLHGHYDGIKNEPLPERWVDLIHYLDERERQMLAAVEIREYLAPSRREHGPTRGMDTTPTSARRSPRWASERRRLRGASANPMIF
jgi:hypothetical protein